MGCAFPRLVGVFSELLVEMWNNTGDNIYFTKVMVNIQGCKIFLNFMKYYVYGVYIYNSYDTRVKIEAQRVIVE